MFVTKEWVHSYMPNGGVSKKQLEILGFPGLHRNGG